MSGDYPPARTIAAGRVFVGPVDGNGPWREIGTHTGEVAFSEQRPVPADVPETSTNPLDPDRMRLSMDHCDAFGVRERQGAGASYQRLITPCWLRPNHDGNVHEGAAGTWIEPDDPLGIKTVRPEPAETPQRVDRMPRIDARPPGSPPPAEMPSRRGPGAGLDNERIRRQR